MSHLLPSSAQIISSCQFFLKVTVPDIESGNMGRSEAIEILEARIEYCDHHLQWFTTGDANLNLRLVRTKCLTLLGAYD